MDSYSDVYEAMNEYYKLKTSYEEKIRTAKLAIRNKTTNKKGDLITEQVKKRLNRNHIPKCISCNKAVGTIFSNSNGKLIAKCGANNDAFKKNNTPCSLNIEINKGSIITSKLGYDDVLYNKNLSINSIIKLKLDLLFKYISEEETLEKFETIRGEYEEECEQHQYLLSMYKTVLDKLENKPRITSANNEFTTLLEFMQAALEEYKKTKDKQYLQDILAKHIDDLIPLLHELRKLKYDYYEIEKNEYTDEFNLVTFPCSINSMEMVSNENEPQIISNVI
tara:strand:- start:99 stop:935 length:837 start_codon:yes stop_codon:yes gene_type:complete